MEISLKSRSERVSAAFIAISAPLTVLLFNTARHSLDTSSPSVDDPVRLDQQLGRFETANKSDVH